MDKSSEQRVLAEIQTLIVETGHTAFQECIAIQRWPDGSHFNGNDLQLALQAMMIYEHKHLSVDQRTGFVHRASCHNSSSQDSNSE